MKTLSIIIASALLAGCASVSTTTGTTKLSRELVDRSLVKGTTTKEQVRQLLGEPQSVTSSDMAAIPGMPAETWSYTKTFYRDAADKGFGRAVAHAMINPYASPYDRIEVSILMVMFDKSGRVSGHTFSTSASGAAR
jgi:outer membrane protein assembly factor BamE (lipoprotein component of BamABCDE complex)